MTDIKITRIGDSLGVVLPPEILARLRVGDGDKLFVTESPNGLTLTPYDPDVAGQVEAGREFAHVYRAAFHQLAD